MENLLKGIVELNDRITALENNCSDVDVFSPTALDEIAQKLVKEIILVSRLTDILLDNIDVGYLADEVTQRILNNADFINTIADCIEDRITDNIACRVYDEVESPIVDLVTDDVKEWIQDNITIDFM